MKIEGHYTEIASTGEASCSHEQLRTVIDDGWQMIQCERCLRRWDSTTGKRRVAENRATCNNNSPSWFVGHWREWHRGHGCDRDDGKPRSETATTEISQHAANESTGFLTDAELRFLRARTTSGDTMLVRALDELTARREAGR